ncbi:hypothetical protein B0H14DRAFT_2353453 [Mycena olivaceomarginata]|nr:hypothetical protein B0H14DRAFT_2353453 [Mycena olivaceomarginata]
MLSALLLLRSPAARGTPAVSPNPPNNSTLHYPTASNLPANQQHAPPPPPDPTGLTEEAPPAYTTRPDVYQGESTLEYGPSRPFQQAPPPLHQLTGQNTGASSTAQFPPAHWSSAYPGRQQQQQYAPPPQPPLPPLPPPQASAPPTPHVSEFARDFYATATIPPGAFSDVSGARNASSADPGYLPPPGPPSPNARTPSPTGTGTGRGAGAGAGLPDDGRPTSTPVPGHPLLLNGNMLVYPPHHQCHKCNNTGFKHGDPSRPCHKCWSRYSRPYAGALAYAPNGAGSSSHATLHAHTTFQRPLPRLSNSYLAPPALPPRPASYPPPPGPSATVYAPGDARMGGAPCWRCAGRGMLSFLVFETIPCSVCRGVGRVFG